MLLTWTKYRASCIGFSVYIPHTTLRQISVLVSACVMPPHCDWGSESQGAAVLHCGGFLQYLKTSSAVLWARMLLLSSGWCPVIPLNSLQYSGPLLHGQDLARTQCQQCHHRVSSPQGMAPTPRCCCAWFSGLTPRTSVLLHFMHTHYAIPTASCFCIFSSLWIFVSVVPTVRDTLPLGVANYVLWILSLCW